MRKLQPSEYHRIDGLIKSTHYQLSIASVIAGMVPGDIFVDRVEAPKSALIKTPECLVVAGDATRQGFNHAIRQEIDFFEQIICDSPEWEPHLHEFHSNPFLKKYQRMYYHLQELRYGDYKNDLPPAVSLARIDHALFEQQDLNNIQDVLDWITKNWGTIDHFEKYGLGMCIRNQTDIISWCLLDCRLEEQGEMGIQTDPAFRRQGYGAITVAATVAACLGQGICDIGWHCVATNIGSRNLAKKVGFTPCAEYFAYTPYPPIENEHDLTPVQWAEWAAYYEHASLVEPQYSWEAFDCWAKAGDVERTIHHLTQEVITQEWKITRKELSEMEIFQRFHDSKVWIDFLDSLS